MPKSEWEPMIIFIIAHAILPGKAAITYDQLRIEIYVIRWIHSNRKIITFSNIAYC